MTAYQPIACITHERLEYAVLRRQPLNLAYQDETGHEQRSTVLPTDVYTRAGAEWLQFQNTTGHTQTVRLDRIISANPAP